MLEPPPTFNWLRGTILGAGETPGPLPGWHWKDGNNGGRILDQQGVV